jgi:hypothetical protein|tara:strand:+ start:466 stop:693 length:228 start_codon:yes stop_codon:yes gene_type:complete
LSTQNHQHRCFRGFEITASKLTANLIEECTHLSVVVDVQDDCVAEQVEVRYFDPIDRQYRTVFKLKIRTISRNRF